MVSLGTRILRSKKCNIIPCLGSIRNSQSDIFPSIACAFNEQVASNWLDGTQAILSCHVHFKLFSEQTFFVESNAHLFSNCSKLKNKLCRLSLKFS